MQDFSESQKEFINDLFDKLNNTITEKVGDIREELKVQISKIKEQVAETVEQLNQNIKEVEAKNEKLKKNVTYLERKLRKNNIVVFGIGQEEQNLYECIINIFRNILELDIGVADLNDVYRVSTKKSDKNPIIVEFVSFKNKLLVLSNAKKLRGKHIFIAKDQCAEDREQSKILIDHQRRAKARGQKAYIKKGKLYIDGNELILNQFGERKEVYPDCQELEEEITLEVDVTRACGKGEREKKKAKPGPSKEQKPSDTRIQTRSVIGPKK